MPQHDQLHRYLFENFAVRGELVTVSETLQQILENHTYPQPVKNVLAELLVATSLLTATLKFAGDITVQLQGDGPLSLAVINGNTRPESYVPKTSREPGLSKSVHHDKPERAQKTVSQQGCIQPRPLTAQDVNNWATAY